MVKLNVSQNFLKDIAERLDEITSMLDFQHQLICLLMSEEDYNRYASILCHWMEKTR